MADRKEYFRQWYLKNKEKILTQQKQYQKDNPEKVKETKHKYYIKNKSEYLKKTRDYHSRNAAKIQKKWREHYKIYQRERRKRLKREAFGLLGNKCVHCGFNDFRALQIDHINGGGYKAVWKVKKNTTNTYKEIIVGNTKLYQLLCANCNWIKRWEKDEVSRVGYRKKYF